jgi:cobalt-zinc-cadmium efflux system outer membrane protein
MTGTPVLPRPPWRVALLALTLSAHAALCHAADPAPVGLREYLDAVAANNLDLQAQRETVNASQAAVSVAGVRPDPQFTGGIASTELYRPDRQNASTAVTAGLAFTIETAGKRGARVRAAESNVKLTEANVASFQRQLDADASAAFIEACRAEAVVVRKQSSLDGLREVVRANETRFRVGDIGRLELTQSKLEADRFQAEVLSARADAAAARINLALFTGQRYEQVFGARPVQCEWHAAEAPQDADTLVGRALESRSDVRAAKAAVDNAEDGVGLARANRWVDPVLNVGVTNTPSVPAVLDAGGNIVNYPAQRSLALGVTVTVPIPLSRLQQGELKQALSALTQAQLQWRSVSLKAEGDVRATLAQYDAAATNFSAYQEHLLADAERVLEGTRISYRKGASSLLELLDAQRSADEVYLAYLQAAADRANALIRLQLSIGAQPAL